MKTSSILLAGVAVAVLAIGGIWVGKYNSLTTLDERADRYEHTVQTALQRRADLINNLAEVAKGYASHEQKTLIETAQARAGKVAQTTSAKPEDVKAMKENQAMAAAATQQALMAFNQVREAYPELKANQQFNKLMAELRQTEDQIMRARNLANATVQKYNVAVRRFPGSIVASIHGFETKEYFNTDAGSKEAPKLKFN